MNSIKCRCHGQIKHHEPIDRYQNFESSMDEDGKIILTPCEPVVPALADDYSVSILALQGRSSVGSSRVNIDPCDLQDFLDKH